MTRQDRAYLRICTAIEDDIRAGTFSKGHRLPGEHWLADHFGVSRMTVRQALAELTRKQLITTRPGSGSYITFDHQQLEWAQGWSRAMMLHGAHVEARVLRFGPLEDEKLAAQLQVEPRFIALDRLRLLDGVRPVSLERSRIPLNGSTEALLDVDFARESLMDALHNRANLIPAKNESWIEVTRLRTEEAHQLERSIGEAFLLSRNIIRTMQGVVIEHVTSLLDPAHFRLHMQFDLK